MTSAGVGTTPGLRLLAPGRLLGVDAARGIALLGMMSVHVVPGVTASGDVTWAYRISAGRASALFAVLAGLSLVLSTRDRTGRAALAPGSRRGVLARAGFIAAVGLTLGVLPSGVAVILVHYGVLFAVGALFLRLGRRTLLVLAGCWLLLSPVVGHMVRSHLPPGPGPNPSWLSLADLPQLATTVLFTGYYPVLQWTAYLLVGMAVGRMPLRRPATGAGLLVLGLGLAVLAKAVSALLLGPLGGAARLVVPESSVLFGLDLPTALRTGIYGTTPTTSWWWLAVAGPHSGTPLDLLHTTGTSLAVLGGCLLLATVLHGRATMLLLPVAAAGSMTLTLYSLHVVTLAATPGAVAGRLSSGTVWFLHAALAVALASVWQLTGRRGPLEGVAAEITAAARGSATHGSSSRESHE
ncbi:MAG: heparan-alpha-glucosaminide N-acetyltransferase domain-containing protein [Actinomycetes bacterium]